jgi:hypothetical protein
MFVPNVGEVTRIEESPALSARLHSLWISYFKRPLHTLDDSWRLTYGVLWNDFSKCEWYKVYDFIEFVARELDAVGTGTAERFKDLCNAALRQEVSGYRFVGGRIMPISSEEEMAAIGEALNLGDPFKPVAQHLGAALDKLADRREPDYRNSIKESISAVESMAKLVSGNRGPGLDAALDELAKRTGLHGALKKAFASLYGYTSNAEGIRHALPEEANLSFDDAKFMLVVCSAFVNYVKAKM